MLVLEGRAVFQLIALKLCSPLLRAKAPRGSGQPVLVVPGFATDDRWTTQLRRFLRAIGYRPHGWGLGKNRGNVRSLIPKVVERTAKLAADSGQRISGAQFAAQYSGQLFQQCVSSRMAYRIVDNLELIQIQVTQDI